jgi:hypothetical protein
MKGVMQNFIRPSSASRPSSLATSATRDETTPLGGSSFRELLAETLRGAAEAERAVAKSIAKVGATKSGPEELIVLQAAVYRTARDFELLAKLVDKTTGAVKQALQSTQA